MKKPCSQKSHDTVPLKGYFSPTLEEQGKVPHSTLTCSNTASAQTQHPASQFSTGAFRYRTGSPYSGTGLLPASAVQFIPVPVCSPAFRHLKTLCEDEERYTLHVYTAGGEEGYTLHVRTEYDKD
jgi:hypothetical protein